MKEQYPIYVAWSETLDWILDRTERFPKAVRFSISSRIAILSLNVMELIVEAIYTRRRSEILRRLRNSGDTILAIPGTQYLIHRHTIPSSSLGTR